MSESVRADGSDAVASLLGDGLDRKALAGIVASGDARQAWLISDMLRFVQSSSDEDALVKAFTDLTGRDGGGDWQSVTNHLIAWDLPAAPGYVATKAELFTAVEPGWKPFFSDPNADIDWRLLSWGGVRIDDRPAGDTEPCLQGCIPALDDPGLTDAAGGDWYPDKATVFGVLVGDDALALPKNIMEVQEMVNVSLGGRRLGIPYCTLCGSAQAYFTDPVPNHPAVLRTSGLLSR